VESNTGHQAVAWVLRLPNQMTVLVGRDLREPEILRRGQPCADDNSRHDGPGAC
jgi:hypothetical protein